MIKLYKPKVHSVIDKVSMCACLSFLPTKGYILYLMNTIRLTVKLFKNLIKKQYCIKMISPGKTVECYSHRLNSQSRYLL